MRCLICLFLALTLSSSPSARADVLIYSTDFEAPKYRAGELLDGQDGWVAFFPEDAPYASVVDFGAASGSQAVRVNNPVVPGLINSTGPYYEVYYAQLLNYDPLASGTPRVRTSVDIRLEDLGGDWESWGALRLFDPAGDNIASLNFNQNGELFFYNSDPSDTDVTVPGLQFGRYYNIEIEVDFSNLTASAWLDGNSIGSITATTATRVLSDVNLVVGTQSDRSPRFEAFFDNLEVSGFSSVPEPGSILLVSAMFGVSLLRFRRLH